MGDLNGHEQDRLTLSPADAAAVDAVLDASEAAEAEPARRVRAEAWLNVLEGAAVAAPASDLVERTLEAVRDSDRLRIPAAEASDATPSAYRPRWRRRLAELGAMGVAAVLFVAVLFAGLGQAKRSQIRVACVGNLQKIGAGMNAYSSDAGGHALPMVAMPSNHNWLRGTYDGAHSNSGHLMPLVSKGYVVKAVFDCPGMPAAAEAVGMPAPSFPWDMGVIGYSYRNLYGADRPKWDGSATTIIMTDRNPLFTDMGRKGIEQRNSANHAGKGNNVLLADGSVTWATSPDFGPGHDNIWTIGSGKDRLLTYTGIETPGSLTDVIVCP
jgi:prepilin-type processing-associated H-X9-DG protein